MVAPTKERSSALFWRFLLRLCRSRRRRPAKSLHQLVNLRHAFFVLMRLPGRIVQVLEQACEPNKETASLVLVLKGIVALNEAADELEFLLLPVQGHGCIHRVKC